MRTRTRPRPRRPTEEQQDRAQHNAALASLSQHPSWPDLQAAIIDKRDRIRATLMTQTFSPEPVNQRNVDFWRGFVAGMRYVGELPKGGEDKLEAYLRRFSVNQQGVEE